jgi:hypothetical protein
MIRLPSVEFMEVMIFAQFLEPESHLGKDCVLLRAGLVMIFGMNTVPTVKVLARCIAASAVTVFITQDV